MRSYQLGMRYRPESVALKFSSVFRAARLPTPPQTFGRSGLVTNYGMLENDRLGDCVPAGIDHIVKLRNRVVGVDVRFTDADVVIDYSGMSGYSSWNPLSDRGTDMQAAASYWQKTGVRDSRAVRHRIDAYVDLRVGDIDELLLASWLFVGCGMGINIPSTAEDQFDAGEPWDVVSGASDEGGHFVPIIDRRPNGNLVVVTWGREQEMTRAFAEKYMVFGNGYLSKDIISKTTNLSPDALGYDALDAYLKELQS